MQSFRERERVNGSDWTQSFVRFCLCAEFQLDICNVWHTSDLYLVVPFCRTYRDRALSPRNPAKVTLQKLPARAFRFPLLNKTTSPRKRQKHTYKACNTIYMVYIVQYYSIYTTFATWWWMLILFRALSSCSLSRVVHVPTSDSKSTFLCQAIITKEPESARVASELKTKCVSVYVQDS